MNFDLNASMIALATQRSEQLAKELQADAVIVLIAHSKSKVAVGYTYAYSESKDSIRQILQDTLDDFEVNP